MKLDVTNAIGFTGTRKGMTPQQSHWLDQVLSVLSSHADEFHHGDCYGADTEAAYIAERIGFRVYAHPGPYQATRGNARSHVTFEPLPYLERNQIIVDSTRILVAVPSARPNPRSGTMYTVRYAQRQKKMVIVYPDPQFKQYG